MLNREIKQNHYERKIKNTNFYIIYKAQRLYWAMICVCVSSNVGGALLCVCGSRGEPLCVAFAVACACSVSATRIYVTCSYSIVFCHVSKFFVGFFVQFFQFIQFHSCRDSWWLWCNPATSVETQSSSESSVPPLRRPPRDCLRASGRGGVMTSGQYVPLYPFPPWEIKSRSSHFQHRWDPRFINPFILQLSNW